MLLKRLKLKNIGIFKDVDLDFKDNLTVIIGNNSTGKTTIINSLVISSYFLNNVDNKIEPNRNLLPITNSENIKDRSEITFYFTKKEFIEIKYFLSDSFFDKPSKTNSYIEKSTQFEIPIIPISAHRKFAPPLEKQDFYNTDEIDKKLHFQSSEYLDTEDKNFQHWLVSRYFLRNEAWASSYLEELNYFRRKIKDIFNPSFKIEFKDVNIRKNPVFIIDENELEFKYLSSGIQSILIIIYKIISGLSIFYNESKKENIFEQKALVLIDEIESHLHPEWQKTIIASLINVFPNCQFILTTHSPIIISTCSKNQVIKLERTTENTINTIYPDNTKGWLSEDILNELMEVESSRDNETQLKIDRLQELYIKKLSQELKKSEIDEVKSITSFLSKTLPATDPIITLTKLESLEKSLKVKSNA